MELTKEHFDDQLKTLATKEDIRLLKLDLKQVKETVEKIDKRDKEDSNAFVSDILQLQDEVKKFKQLS